MKPSYLPPGSRGSRCLWLRYNRETVLGRDNFGAAYRRKVGVSMRKKQTIGTCQLLPASLLPACTLCCSCCQVLYHMTLPSSCRVSPWPRYSQVNQNTYLQCDLTLKMICSPVILSLENLKTEAVRNDNSSLPRMPGGREGPMKDHSKAK